MADFAARYARAFADVVLDAHISIDQVNVQLNDFLATLEASADLRQALFNPALAADVRVRVIDALAPRLHLGREVRNFLAVLLRHDRMNAIEEIVAEYRAEIDRRQGISEVEVVSARRLDADERYQMEQEVARLAGTQVRARFREDNDLIGGAVVRIGSTIYDGSVRGRLDRMKQELMAG
ncbi:MAG TPA: ATP synthase F1 subunit delta [Acidobacteriaceae bacterium]|jgi:F-type H+-transporting ATPase subunit delta